MTAFPRQCLRLVAGLAALLSGCGGSAIFDDFDAVPTYGVPPPEHDPTVVIADFTYTPASPVRIGDKLTFTARLSKPVPGDAGIVGVLIGGTEPSTATLVTTLNDWGNPPDETAMDGIWTGDAFISSSAGTATGLPVLARLEWFDLFSAEPFYAAALTVLPQGEDN